MSERLEIAAYLRRLSADEEKAADCGVNVDHCYGAAQALTDAADAVAGGLHAWEQMSDEQRLAFLAAHPCCRGCGSLDTACQCENDE